MIKRITALLGEEDLEIPLPEGVTGGVVQTGRFGRYRVTRRGDRVVIRGVQLFVPSLYYFNGRLHSAPDGRMRLEGRVKMTLVPKIFMFAWSATIMIGLVFGAGYALYSAFGLLLVPSRENEIALEGAGIMVAVATVCVVFGVIIFLVMRWLSGGQRRRLKEYSEGVATASKSPLRVTE